MSLFNKSYSKQLSKSRRLERRATRLLNRNRRNKRKNLENKKRAAKNFKPPKYSTYMKSGRWRQRRIEYYKKYGKQCVICGATNVNLHHVTYERLGREEDTDLILLCEEHHEALHEAVSTKRDMRQETYQFIIEQQQLLEFKNIIN